MSDWLHGLKGLIALLGSLVTVAGSIVGILIATNVIEVGGDKQPENKPPVVGSIFLENPVVVPGESTRAEIAVSDPERDSLEIRWTANSGSFELGNTGSSVIYQPPEAGASIQLTVEVSDGNNPPERVSENFKLATPRPAAAVTGSIDPPVAVSTETTAPILPPVPESIDLSGRWVNEAGYLEFSNDGFGEYIYTDHDLSGFQVGQGTGYVEGDSVYIEGQGILLDVFGGYSNYEYYGWFTVGLAGNLIQGELFEFSSDTPLGSVQFIRDTSTLGP